MVDLISAEVADIRDPQDKGRIKVRSATMGEGWEGWAQVLRSDRASMPPIYEPGDFVMIGFEGGDPELPIVLGVLSAHIGAAGGAMPSPAREYTPARLLETEHDWDDLVLPAETREGLDAVAAWIVNERELLGDWGLGRHFDPGSRVLFCGPPGTGKTMAASVLAKQLAMPIHRIDLASVVSKYIGETEKNLREMFAAAEANDAILFFDEADALFGRRSEVRDAHERYANIEIDYLLQRMETFPGVVILASNLKQNLDDAFTRRIRFIVRFPMPDAPGRLELWRRALGALPPDRVGHIDLAAIAGEHELSGGQIMNVLGHACVRAVERATALEEGDIRAAIARLHP